MINNQIINLAVWKTQDSMCWQFCCNELDVLYGHTSYTGFVNYILLNFVKLAYETLAGR